MSCRACLVLVILLCQSPSNEGVSPQERRRELGPGYQDAITRLMQLTTEMASSVREFEDLQQKLNALKKTNKELRLLVVTLREYSRGYPRSLQRLKQLHEAHEKELAKVRKQNSELMLNYDNVKTLTDSLRNTLSRVTVDSQRLQRDFEALQQERETLTSNVTVSKKEVEDLKKQIDEVTSNGSRATFVRWGNSACPQETQLIYKGQAGGGVNTHSGGGRTRLCLPDDPQQQRSQIQGENKAYVVGGEYGNWATGDKENMDVPCAVCYSPTRKVALMVPARSSCDPEYHLEYKGYLMGGIYDESSGPELVCVDEAREAIPGSEASKEGCKFVLAAAVCSALKCPPFESSKALSCVVCTR